MYKKLCLLFLAGISLGTVSQAQILKNLSKAVSSAASSASGSTTGISESDAGSAIKEALSKGVTSGIGVLNKTDGFFGSEVYKLLLPPDAVKIGNTLRSVGLGAQVDQAILSINRAAEKAVGSAAPIFVSAIKGMSIADALNILKGTDSSATVYFKGKTTTDLKAAFAPVVKGALDSTNATKYYADIINSYNKLPTTFKKANPDLQDYVTGMAVNALFDQIKIEEKNIRNNSTARTSALLQKVFGSVAK
ncbi:MAG: hypothetical protein H6Q26_923 [Bacteroidetes bacterium]|uniref:DUF4197 domain-containing protein n=1 Tax=unclassified Chitinophaga TaxID=2619133 RepID=UPI0009C81101|nr:MULTISPECIES: DUF4197 domain-containing protein [unclassified Chitinophaga]MBP1650766.1 hypothetical protein [Bacteroidota bacterium]OMP78817.1 hypothetical protein BW716_12915 [[Flexibacter] sp. ATCC 35208]WPV68455.1 DUF4197 domain-containing protein [Chitinophaga sp. LS1]